MAALAIGGLAAASTTAAGYAAYSGAAYTIGAMVANQIFKDKSQTTQNSGTQLTSLDITIAAYGTVIPKIFGTIRTNAIMVWAPPIKVRKRKVKSGGKGSFLGTSQKSTYEEYSASLAFVLCNNEISGVRKIYANQKLVCDYSENNVLISNSLQCNSIKVYNGTRDQMPDPTISSYEQNVSAMRGKAYVVIDTLALAPFGNSVPNFTFEVVGLDGQITYINSTMATGVNGIAYGSYTSTFDQDLNRYISFYSGGGSYAPYFEVVDCTNGQVLRKQIANVVESYNGRIYKTIDNNYILNNNRYLKLFNSQLNFKKKFDFTKFQNYLPDAFRYDGASSFTNNRADFKNYGVHFYDQNTLVLTTINSFEDERFNEINYIPFEYTSNQRISPYLITNKHTKGNGLAMYDNFIYFAMNNSTDTGFDIFKLNVYMKNIVKVATTNGYYIGNGGLDNNIFMIDDVSESLILSCTRVGVFERTTETIIKYSLKNFTQTLLDINQILKNKYPTFNGNFTSNDAFNINENRQIVYSATGNGVLILLYTNIDNFNVYSISDYPSVGLGAIGFHSTYYNTAEQSFIYTNGINGTDGRIIKFIPERRSQKTAMVSDIMEELSVSSGLTLNDINTAEISEIECRGYTINNDAIFRANIEQLQVAFDYTAVETDYKIKFVKNQQPISKIIYATELGAMNYSTGSKFETYTTTRMSELDLPTDYDVTFIDYNDDYNQNNQSASSQVRAIRSSASTDLAVVLNATEAREIAQRNLFNSYVQRESFTFSTNYNHLDVEVNDVIQLEDEKNDAKYILKIVKKDTDGGIIKFEAVSYSSFTFDQYAVGSNGKKEYTGIKTVAKTMTYIMDIPLLTDEDFVGSYVASTKANEGEWDGSVLLRSTDAREYSNKAQFYDSVTCGFATTKLENFTGGNVIDYMNSVTVKVNDELESISEDQMLSMGNIALLGNELIQFKNAEIISDKTYKLSGLLRGRFNTEQYINTHVVSEDFVLLDTMTVQAFILDSSLLNRELFYKNVSIGLNIDNVNPFTQSISGKNQETYAVDDVQYGRNSTGDVKVSFKARVRGNGFLQDYTDVLDPDGSSYEVDVLSDAGLVLRTIKFTNANTFTYTAAQQVTDFTALKNNISMNIYKMNAIVGRGKVKSVIV